MSDDSAPGRATIDYQPFIQLLLDRMAGVPDAAGRMAGGVGVCVTLRDDGAPIVIIDGVNGDVHVGVYDKDTETRIHRNGKPL